MYDYLTILAVSSASHASGMKFIGGGVLFLILALLGFTTFSFGTGIKKVPKQYRDDYKKQVLKAPGNARGALIYYLRWPIFVAGIIMEIVGIAHLH